MNNEEKIKQMNTDELVQFLRYCNCDHICVYGREYDRIYGYLCNGNCNEGIKKWLESEAENVD